MEQTFIQLVPTHLAEFCVLMVLSLLFGMLLGLERVAAHKTAGIRTYALVSMSATFFVLIARSVMEVLQISGSTAVLQFSAALITGIGFLGAGLIFHKDGNHIQNVTTAAGLWMCAAIGMATGFGLIWYGAIATLFTFIILKIISKVEMNIKLRFFPDNGFTNSVEQEK